MLGGGRKPPRPHLSLSHTYTDTSELDIRIILTSDEKNSQWEGTASRNTGRLQFPEQWNKSEAGPGVGDKESLTKSDSEFCQICDAKKSK